MHTTREHLELLKKPFRLEDALLASHAADVHDAAPLAHDGCKCLANMPGAREVGVQCFLSFLGPKSIPLGGNACRSGAGSELG